MKTTIEKSHFSGWNAKTLIELPTNLDNKDGKATLSITTSKNGSYAQIIWVHSMGEVSTIGGGDYFKRFPQSITRATEKTITQGHAQILQQVEEIKAACIAHQLAKGV